MMQKTEIHGFEYNKLNSIAGSKVNKVARGGFFGGPKHTIQILMEFITTY
jgi:hypothetical protein